MDQEGIYHCDQKKWDEKSWIVRPKQKSVGWMENHTSKVPRTGELIVALCFGTATTAKGCFEPPRLHGIVGCKVDADSFGVDTEALFVPYARQVLNKKCNISDSDKVARASKIVGRVLDALQSMRQMKYWKVQAVLCRVRFFPLHIM